MCKINKSNGDHPQSRIDPCLRKLIIFLNLIGIKTIACCCGHGKYPMTIIAKSHLDHNIEILNQILIPRSRRIYKRDSQGFYYIPEIRK